MLVVEDEAEVRAIMLKTLKRLGYATLEAASGDEALNISSHTGGIDLVITDLVMPRMSGDEVAARLRAVRPELKVLYISGYAGEAILRRGVQLGGTEFLQKPFTPGQLADRVRKALDG